MWVWWEHNSGFYFNFYFSKIVDGNKTLNTIACACVAPSSVQQGDKDDCMSWCFIVRECEGCLWHCPIDMEGELVQMFFLVTWTLSIFNSVKLGVDTKSTNAIKTRGKRKWAMCSQVLFMTLYVLNSQHNRGIVCVLWRNDCHTCTSYNHSLMRGGSGLQPNVCWCYNFCSCNTNFKTRNVMNRRWGDQEN